MCSLKYVLLFLDLIWFHLWFGIAIWFEVDASLAIDYRDNIRDMLFHSLNLAGVVYLLRKPSNTRVSWLAFLPSYIALLADIQHLVSVCVNLPANHGAAWGCFLALSIWAVCTSVGGIAFFFYKKTNINMR